MLGARFILVEGVMHQDQPREAIAAFAVTLKKYDTPITLAALHTMTSLTGSAILALALAEEELTLEETWALAHLDERTGRPSNGARTRRRWSAAPSGLSICAPHSMFWSP